MTDRHAAEDSSADTSEIGTSIEQVTWQGPKELSPAQLPIWHAEILRRGTSRWTHLGVTTLDGIIDQSRLDHALKATVGFYPALRTCIVRQGRKAQQVLHDARGFSVGWHDFSGMTEQACERSLAKFLLEAEHHQFQLYDSWLFKAHVLACTPDRHVLLLMMHHIAADGMTYPLVLQHAASVYRGETIVTRTDQIYERWLDRQTRQDPDPMLDAALDFYQHELAGASLWNEQLYDRQDTMPLHEPPNLPKSVCVLEPAVVQGLSRLAEQKASSLFVVLLAAYGVALRQALDSADLLIGVFVSGRGGEAGLVAMAVNMVLVRLRLEALMEPGALIGRVKEAWRPARCFKAASIHTLHQLAQRRAVARRTAAPADVSQEDGPIPNRVQISINFLDMRNTVFDVPGIVSRTTHPQSGFPLNDLMLVIFREHDDSLQLRLINGSGTPRLSVERLKTLLEMLTDVLRAWGDTCGQVC